MSSEDSDIELQSALPKTSNKRMPPSPSDDLLKKKQDKKLTTKTMINQALIDLKSRKGVSLYAIKKYITEKYNVDTEKNGFYIKKYIKSAVENGTIVQIKGIGASGSFKLVPVKEKKEKKPKQKKMTKEKSEKSKDPEKKKKIKEITKKSVGMKKDKEKPKSKEKKPNKEDKTVKPIKQKKKVDKEKAPKEKKDGGEKVKKVRIAKGMQTPARKKPMMKRKSIGSIIKPPKMKPKAQP